MLNETYATQIARDRNTRDAENGSVGYALRFDVDATFLETYEVHQVGGIEHQEYWIPAEELDQFNDAIVGNTEIVGEYRGDPPRPSAR